MQLTGDRLGSSELRRRKVVLGMLSTLPAPQLICKTLDGPEAAGTDGSVSFTPISTIPAASEHAQRAELVKVQ